MDNKELNTLRQMMRRFGAGAVRSHITSQQYGLIDQLRFHPEIPAEKINARLDELKALAAALGIAF